MEKLDNKDINKTTWWFHFLIDHPYLGKIPILDEHIFQLGWFNHHLKNQWLENCGLIGAFILSFYKQLVVCFVLRARSTNRCLPCHPRKQAHLLRNFHTFTCWCDPRRCSNVYWTCFSHRCIMLLLLQCLIGVICHGERPTVPTI